MAKQLNELARGIQEIDRAAREQSRPGKQLAYDWRGGTPQSVGANYQSSRGSSAILQNPVARFAAVL